MKKRLLRVILALYVITNLMPSTFIAASAVEPVTDAIIESRINELYNLLGGKYFTVSGNGCQNWVGGHGCSNCSVNQVLNAQWFKDIFGTIKPSQMFLNGGKSCMGFVEFAEWYIYRTDSNDTVLRESQTEYSNGFNYATISANAHIGDYIRVGGHSFILIGADSSGVEVLDCNWGGPYNCKVDRHRISYSHYSGKTVWISKMYSKTAGSRAEHFDSTIISGNWVATIPANYKLLCYSSANATASSTYISAKSSSYQISCTQQAKLSNGKTRYFFVSGDNKSLWFEFDPSGSITIVDRNTVCSCTIYFDANGGSVNPSTKSFPAGSLIGELPTPTFSGHVFSGWSTEKESSGMIVTPGSLVVTEDMTLYAIWRTQGVTFDANGGSTPQAAKIVAIGSAYGDLPIPTRTGYTFDGWYTSASGGTQITSSTIASGAYYITLYAHWNRNCTNHTYDADICTNCGARLPYDNGFDASAAGTYQVSENTAYIRTGPYQVKDLVGTMNRGETLQVAGSVINSYNHTWMKTADGYYVHADKLTLFSETQAQSYYVVLDDGSVCSRITVTNGETYGNLPIPAKEGYAFDGWYTAASGGVQVTSMTTVNLTGNQTLYAHWAKEEPIICSHAKGQLQYSDTSHPHYNHYTCSKCGESFTDYSVTPDRSCDNCWGPWSSWSVTPVSTSSTREVETRQVKISEGYTEYRYGRYIDSTGTHDCWCGKYLEGLSYVSGGAALQYSVWTPQQYSTSGKDWSCGYCNGNHIGVDHTGADGRDWWKEYLLPSGSYYWEESRWVDAVYETQYRYRDLSTP